MKHSRIFLLVIFSALMALDTSGGAYAKPEKKAENPAKPAGNSLNIVAVVGDQAISSFDVDSRIKFVLTTTKMSNTPEVIANIKPQVIRTLIDESLQLQEAINNGVKVDDKDIAQAIAGIEAQKGMPAGGISAMLSANNVPEKTFNDQIRAQLSWNKLLSRTIRPKIKIGDEEVALAQGHTHPDAPKQAPITIKEVEIAVINLPVDKPARATEISKLSDKLYGELRKGARFEEVARQFSSGDGKSFWISPNQLEQNVAQALSNTKLGSITPPIRTNDGFTIIKLVNIKANKPDPKALPKEQPADVEITLKEILLKIKATASAKEADVLLQIGEAVSKNPGSCEEKGVAGLGDMSDYDIEVNMRKAPLSDLPPALRAISDSLKMGGISAPFASAEGIRLYMLCGKKELGADSSYAQDKLREILFRQKYELEAQKYLRNLRRETFIEIRV